MRIECSKTEFAELVRKCEHISCNDCVLCDVCHGGDDFVDMCEVVESKTEGVDET